MKEILSTVIFLFFEITILLFSAKIHRSWNFNQLFTISWKQKIILQLLQLHFVKFWELENVFNNTTKSRDFGWKQCLLKCLKHLSRLMNKYRLLNMSGCSSHLWCVILNWWSYKLNYLWSEIVDVLVIYKLK